MKDVTSGSVGHRVPVTFFFTKKTAAYFPKQDVMTIEYILK